MSQFTRSVSRPYGIASGTLRTTVSASTYTLKKPQPPFSDATASVKTAVLASVPRGTRYCVSYFRSNEDDRRHRRQKAPASLAETERTQSDLHSGPTLHWKPLEDRFSCTENSSPAPRFQIGVSNRQIAGHSCTVFLCARFPIAPPDSSLGLFSCAPRGSLRGPAMDALSHRLG